jgi:hypothetical protein
VTCVFSTAGASGFLSAGVVLVHRGPGSTFGFLFWHAFGFIILLDVLGFPLLLVGIFGFVSSRHGAFLSRYRAKKPTATREFQWLSVLIGCAKALGLRPSTQTEIEPDRCRKFNRPPAFTVSQRAVIRKGAFYELAGKIKEIHGEVQRYCSMRARAAERGLEGLPSKGTSAAASG